MNVEKMMEIILNDELTHTECEILEKAASDYGIQTVIFFGNGNRIIKIEFDSDRKEKPLKNRLSLIANWFGVINAVETIGKVRDITDYFTDFISDEVMKLTEKEAS